ncbi:MAG: dihydropteroate synthase, partial [Candidatus Marinimicrobia bacterium]|nr:dihydropteroate synthase [Candidatus Neomarinimicrobiota bacterium]
IIYRIIKMKKQYKPIENLTIIGESINDSIPSTNKLFEENDFEGIKKVAEKQVKINVKYLDVNVGMHDTIFFSKVIKEIQSAVDLPLSLDSPSFELQKIGLETYNKEIANNKKPILNSISELRLDFFDLYKIQPFIPILILNEREQNGEKAQNKSELEIYETAKRLVKKAREYNIPNDEIVLDPGVVPIGVDFENKTKMTLKAMELIHNDDYFKDIHFSVGLSNFSNMLPKRTVLESAFITLAKPFGLDFIIGNSKKKYRILDENNPALKAVMEAIESDGYDSLAIIQEFISE